MRWGYAIALLLLAGDAHADEAPVDKADWFRYREGAHFMLGGGFEVFAFDGFPSAGVGYLETSLNVGLASAVEFRLSGLLGIGPGFGSDFYMMILPGLRPHIRFHLFPHWAIWAGFSGRAGMAIVPDGRDPVALLPLYGPDLSLTSFRFGDRGQFEIEHDGGVFLPPVFGFRVGFCVRYLY